MNHPRTPLSAITKSQVTQRALPRLLAKGRRPGPTVWLTAAGHGDEVGGMVVIQDIFRYLTQHPLLKGQLHAFPLMNPIGFETASRLIPISGEDLNRAFPGNATGSLAERIADEIFRAIIETKPDLVLDLHNDWTRSIPYTLLDPMPPDIDNAIYTQTQDIAHETGFLVVLDQIVYTNTLSYTLLSYGIPSVSIELGESYVVNEENIKLGVQSIFGVLAKLGMVNNKHRSFVYEETKTHHGTIFEYSDDPASSSMGVVRFLVKPGDSVHKNQPVARIYNTLGTLEETIQADTNAVVLGHSDYSVAFPGTAVMSFAALPPITRSNNLIFVDNML